MAPGGVAARVTEPLPRLDATHDARRVVNAAEAARPFWSLHICATTREGYSALNFFDGLSWEAAQIPTEFLLDCNSRPKRYLPLRVE